MFFNTTYYNEDFVDFSTQELGLAFSLLEKIQLGGVGSSRMIVEAIGDKLHVGSYRNQDINYSSLELRPKGIIVHLNQDHEQYSWVIPYYKLHIYNTDSFSIHSEGTFVRFRKDKHYLQNKKFIRKISDLKNSFMGITDYYQYF